MKRVSFKVAKAIKKAGYTQGISGKYYASDTFVDSDTIVHQEGSIMDYYNYSEPIIDAPYAMEVWLWLWREKGIRIEIEGEFCIAYSDTSIDYLYQKIYKNSLIDPEEAIIAAIEYLVDNDLIK